MRPELNDALHRLIVSVAAEIQTSLPPDDGHPGGRIAVAHCYYVIKTIMGVPAKHCRDERFTELVEIVHFCRDNATEKHIVSALTGKYLPEPKEHDSATLEYFL